MVNSDEILMRFKSACGLTSDKETASLFGISQPDFARRKKRGSLLPLIIEKAIAQKVNLHWLIAGEGSPQLGTETPKLGHDQGVPETEEIPEEIRDLLQRAKTVLMSGNPIAFDALQRNINYFAYAVESERQYNEMKDSVSEMQSRMASLEDSLKKCIPREGPPGEGEAEEGRPLESEKEGVV